MLECENSLMIIHRCQINKSICYPAPCIVMSSLQTCTIGVWESHTTPYHSMESFHLIWCLHGFSSIDSKITYALLYFFPCINNNEFVWIQSSGNENHVSVGLPDSFRVVLIGGLPRWEEKQTVDLLHHYLDHISLIVFFPHTASLSMD